MASKVAALLVFAPILFTRAAIDTTTAEYELKAALVFNFAKFVEWPPDAPGGPDAPIRICVLGANPFGNFLDRYVAGKRANGRPVKAETNVPLDQAGHCHILFIASSERAQLDRLLTMLAGRPILIVGDVASFAERGGTIGLIVVERHLRFEVNLVTAQRDRLRLSSQLLKVADKVIGHVEREH